MFEQGAPDNSMSRNSSGTYVLPAVKRIGGISLVEILVGLAVAVVVLGALIALMVNTRVNQEISYNNMGVQENGRFAMYFITEDLRNAGYFGCSNTLTNGGASSPVSSSAGSEEGDVDSLSLVYGDPDDYGVVTMTTVPASIGNSGYTINVSVSSSYCNEAPCDLSNVNGNWAHAESAVISNCSAAAIVDIDSVNEASNTITIAADSDLGMVFDSGASIKRLVSANYTIATGASGVSSLFRNGVELVEGIENTQFLYRTNAGAQSDAPTAWSALQGVQMSLLARSVSGDRPTSNTTREYGVNIDAGSHELLGETVTVPSLQGSRRTFASFVTRRNN